MLDFRPKGKRTRNYLARSEQWRLLLLVGAVGAVMMLIGQARQPNMWRWMWFGQQPAAAPQAAGNQPEIDTRLKPKTRRALAADEFVIERAEKPVPATEKKNRFFPGVKPEFLSGVRDDTLFRSAETDAFYHLMKLLKETDEKALEAASTGHVTFTQLFTQPKEYRGELVTVAGTLRRNQRLSAPQNKYGIEKYYELIIQPDDRAEPLLIYCLQPPDNLPQGENLSQPITATGFFYKRQAGMSGDGLRTWPLVLAKTVIAPVAPPAGKVAKKEPMSLVTAMVGSVCVGLLVIWFVVGRTKRGPRFHLPGAGSPEAQRVLARHGLSELKNEEIGPDVRESLELLAQEHQGAQEPQNAED
jgi:hypothetical protein